MSEVLSQSQIDALLNSMKGGGDDSAAPQEKEEKKEIQYRKYDFYSPRKITTEKLKLLRNIYENYSRIASSQMNGMFRLNSDMEVLDVEEQRYYEFSNALTDIDGEYDRPYDGWSRGRRQRRQRLCVYIY